MNYALIKPTVNDQHNNLPGLSHANIGKLLGISAKRVRDLEQRALKKMRDGLRKHGVTSARWLGTE